MGSSHVVYSVGNKLAKTKVFSHVNLFLCLRLCVFGFRSCWILITPNEISWSDAYSAPQEVANICSGNFIFYLSVYPLLLLYSKTSNSLNTMQVRDIDNFKQCDFQNDLSLVMRVNPALFPCWQHLWFHSCIFLYLSLTCCYARTYKYREMFYQGDLQKMTKHNFVSNLEDGKLEKTFPLLFPSVQVAVIFYNQR